MKKNLLKLSIIFLALFMFTSVAYSEGYDDWNDALDVYNSDGLDRPVSATEYKKVIQELEQLKAKNKKWKPFWIKEEKPTQKIPSNEPVKVERHDIIKITTPLYYDGKVVPVGFYKITCTEEDNNYYITFVQGKTSIVRVKANKVSHMDFCADKVNCLETETYQDKYFKINFKTIDYAVSAYLTLIK